MKSAYILLLLLCFQARGQMPLFDHEVRYKVEDGLPQSFVSSILQDVDGFLWVGTLGGIARYDGHHFLSFTPNPADSGSISSGMVVSMQNGPGKTFFVEYENRVYDVFDPITHQVILRDEMAWARSQDLYPLLVDSRGRWWMRTNEWLHVLVDPKAKTKTLFNVTNGNVEDSSRSTLVEGKDGEIYGFTKTGISKYDSTRQKFTLVASNLGLPHLPRGFPQVLPDGRLIVAGEKRLIIFNPASKKFDEALLPAGLSLPIRHMQVAPDRFLYLESDGRIYRWLKNGQFQLVWQIEGKSYVERTIPAFLVDNTGVLWVGTNANGLYKINLRGLPLHAAPYIKNFHTDALSQLPGFNTILPKSWKKEKWGYFFRSHYTASGTLLCSFGREPDEPLRVLKYENRRWTMLPAPTGNTHGIGGITSIGDTIYAVNVDGGLWKWAHTNQQPEFSQLQADFPIHAIVGLATDGTSLLLISERDGIYKFRDAKLVKAYRSTDVKNSTIPYMVSYFTSIIPNPASPSRFWLTTMGQGIIDWDIEKGFIKSISEKDGLPSATIYSVIADQQKRLWVGTNKGLAVVQPDNLKAYTFSKADGLPGNEFNRFHVFRFPDGRLTFGGLEGSVTFDPKQFAPDTTHPKTVFTSLTVNSLPQEFGKSTFLKKPLNSLERLELPYDQNYLAISFAGISFGNPEVLTYRYQLEGYDQQWIYNGTGTTANYTGLPPGHYTFVVNTANASGTWSRSEKRLIIHINPPFWATWWAYLLYTMVVLGAIRAYWQFREKQFRLSQEILTEQARAKNLQELNAAKTRFFDNMTHELRTPLTLILTPLGRLIDQQELSGQTRKNVQYAWENAGHLLGTINQLLDISKTESGRMPVNLAVGHLTEYVLQCLHTFIPEAERKNITFIENIKTEESLFHFDSDKWGKIVFNLLGNAIKFTPAGGKIDLSLETKNIDHERVEAILKVKDTGNGISKDALPHIFERFYMANDSTTRHQNGTGIGLSLVRELVYLMQGSINVISEEGNGSEFIVTIPLKKAEPSIEALPEQMNVNAYPISKRGPETIDDSETPLLVIVEDNAELREFLIESLRENWRVLSAADGTEALEVILNEIPDMIISDVMMPGMDGHELCRRIKTDERISHIPVMLLTAKAAQDSKMQGLAGGADDYLIKPFHFNELEQIISTRMTQRKRFKKHLLQQILPVEPPHELTRTNDIFIDKLYNQLDKLIGESEVNVDLLAAAMNMGRRTFARKLKTLLDITPNELIRRYRLQKAALLLSSGEPVAQVAYQVGFESPSYFSQRFKDQYGVTPTDFRLNSD